jgi:hypothetical protein
MFSTIMGQPFAWCGKAHSHPKRFSVGLELTGTLVTQAANVYFLVFQLLLMTLLFLLQRSESVASSMLPMIGQWHP